MGNNKSSEKSRSRQITQMPHIYSLSQRANSASKSNEESSCCFIFGKKEKISLLAWHRNFLDCIKQVNKGHPQAEWIFGIKKVILQPDYNHNNFFKDMDRLKVPELNQQKKQKLTSLQIQKFKTNLKKSVLIDYDDDSKPSSYTKLIKDPDVNYQSHNSKKNSNQSIDPMDSSLKNNSISNIRRSLANGNRSFSFRSGDQIIQTNLNKSFVYGSQVVHKQPTKNVAIQLEKFLKFTDKLQAHLKNSENILYKVKISFLTYLTNKYSVMIKRKSQDLKRKYVIEQLFVSVKLFIKVYTKMIVDYYHLLNFNADQQFCMINKQENIQTVITTHIFKENDFCSIIYAVLEIYHENDQRLLTQLYSALSEIQPSNFDIPSQYCLNQKTLEKFNKFITYSIPQESETEQRPSVASTPAIQQKISNANKQMFHPYEGCINIFKSLPMNGTPISKMKLITQCADKITEEINNFYKLHSIEADNWYLDPDCILSMFCYLIIKSKVSNLQSHLTIINQFSNEQQSFSIAGYYFSVIEAAIRNLQENSSRYLNTSILEDSK